MKSVKPFCTLPVAAALALAFGDATAQENSEVKALISPDSTLSAGAASVNNDQNARKFGQYNGMGKGGGYGLLDIDLTRRDDTTGTWLTLQGRDLGLDTRELSFGQQKQGDWKYLFEVSEMVRRDPYTVHTGLSGIGTSNLNVQLINKPPMPAGWAAVNGLVADPGVAGSDVELKIRRTALGISAEKWLTPELQFEASARTEQRKGARLFGRTGMTSGDMAVNPTQGGAAAGGNWAILLAPEPISSKTHLVEAKLNFNREKLSISVGYYGSFFVNDFGSLSLNVPASLNRGALWATVAGGASTIQQLAGAAVALPPDNQAHQLYVTGNYIFSPATKANFKYTYTHATQHESFTGMGLSPAATAPADLHGVVDTHLGQFNISSRISKEFSINGLVRFELREDRTPRAVYNTSGAVNVLNNTMNWGSGTQRRAYAKLDGTYRLPDGYSLVGGFDWDRKSVPLPPNMSALFNNQVLFRSRLDEYGVRMELRKALAATVNGALVAEYKERRGAGDWITTTGVTATQNGTIPIDDALSNRVLPDMYMDRNRTKLRGNLDWSPIDRMDLQAVLEHSQDNYNRRFLPTAATPIIPGANDIYTDSLTADGSYAFSDNWKANAFWTMSTNRWSVNKASLLDDTRNRMHTIGIGIKGKVTGQLDIGADLLTTYDRTTFRNLPAGGNIAGWTGQLNPGNFLPSIHISSVKAKFFANYAVDKNSDIRADLVYQRYATDDWTWGYNGVPFLYMDNTTVSQVQAQKAVYLGARYIYKFQ